MTLVDTLDIECLKIIKFIFIHWMFYGYFNPLPGIARTCGRRRKCWKSRTDSKEAKLTIRNDNLFSQQLTCFIGHFLSLFFFPFFPFSLLSFVFSAYSFLFFFLILFCFHFLPFSRFSFVLCFSCHPSSFTSLHLFVSFFIVIGTCWTSGSHRTTRNQRRRCKKTLTTFNFCEN